MITAVDTSVLLDVFGADRQFGEPSRAALARCLVEGGLIAGAVVWAEVTAAFPSPDDAGRAMGRIGVAFRAMDEGAAQVAGAMMADYRRRGGRQSRVVADFLVGAQALAAADRLLTRDRGFYRRYFRELAILDPSPPSR